MRNKEKAEHHKVTRLRAQQQSYQVDTPHNPRTVGGGDHTHGVNLLQRTCTCQKWKLYKIPYSHVIVICIRYQHDAEQYINPCYGVNALFRDYAPVFPALKDKLSWSNAEETRRVFPNPWLIREKGRLVSTRIRIKMDGAGNSREPHHGRRGGGRCNVGCATKRGITKEHALSGTRYRWVVVLQTRYAKFELWHPSKCNLNQNAWYMPLDQNACYIPFNFIFETWEKLDKILRT